MNGFIIVGKSEHGVKLIQEDLNDTSFKERSTMKVLFKRRILDKPYTIDYQFRKLYRKVFNKNLKHETNTYQEGDIVKLIRNRYHELDLIEDVDFSIEVY